MSLIASILAGLLGSLFGSGARAGLAMARAQLEGEPAPEVMNISGSPIAGVVGGLVGVVAGPKTAFWLGAVLGAAGIYRFDAILLKQVGIDLDEMVAKATEAAKSAQAAASEAAAGAGQRASGVAEDVEEAAGDAVESAAEEAGPG